MPYIVNKYNGDFLVSVPDGSVDSTTLDLKFVGKNYLAYGEVQNENFLHLLEHFANTSPPPKPIIGQIWYDSSPNQRKLKVYNGLGFVSLSRLESGSLAPSGITLGDLWWDTDNNQLYAYSGTGYVLVGPATPSETTTKMESRIIYDTSRIPHSVLVSKIDNTVVFVISIDNFTIDNTDPSSQIPGFRVINSGLTLMNTPGDDQTDPNDNEPGPDFEQRDSHGVTVTDHTFWGTAANSSKLGGRYYSDYVTKDGTKFTGLVEFADIGFTVGDSNDLYVKIEQDDHVNIYNQVGDTIHIGARDSEEDGGKLRNTIRITPTEVLPGCSIASMEEYDPLVDDLNDYERVSIGAVNQPFLKVYADDIYITSDVNKKTNITQITDSLDKILSLRGVNFEWKHNNKKSIGLIAQEVENIIPEAVEGEKDGSKSVAYNNLVGLLIEGIKELHENNTITLTSDKNYDGGTVVVFGGDKDLTITDTKMDHRVAGVIKKTVTFNGDYVSTVVKSGTTSCNVLGKIYKGDILVTSAIPGYAYANNKPNIGTILGKALEDKKTDGKGSIRICVE